MSPSPPRGNLTGAGHATQTTPDPTTITLLRDSPSQKPPWKTTTIIHKWKDKMQNLLPLVDCSPTWLHEDTPQGGDLKQQSDVRWTTKEEHLNSYRSVRVSQKVLLWQGCSYWFLGPASLWKLQGVSPRSLPWVSYPSQDADAAE